MEQNETNPSQRASWPIIVGFIVVIALILIGLFLPPISLGERLGLGGGEEQPDIAEATAVSEPATPDGVDLSLTSGTATGVVGIPATDLASNAELAAAGTALVALGAPVGDVYTLSYEGEAPTGRIALPLPAEATSVSTLDLVGWNGSAWNHVPNQIDPAAQKVVAAEGVLPRALALISAAAPQQPALAAEIMTGDALPAEVGPMLNEVSVGGQMLGAAGVLDGEAGAAPTDVALPLLRISNRAAIIDQAALSALLDNPAAQDAQIASVVATAAAQGYKGIHLDYQGVTAAQKAAFTEFVRKLAEAARAQGLLLAVTLNTPAAAGNNWDTGGQDFAAIGDLADIVYLQMPLDPAAYGQGGLAEQLLTWATGQIDRRKLNMLVTAGAVNKVGEAFNELPAELTLGSFGELQVTDGDGTIEPGASVEFALTGSAQPLEWDGNGLTFRYTLEQAGQPQTVWLGNEAALFSRLQMAEQFALRGATVRALDEIANGAGYAAALAALRGAAEAPQPSGAALVWTIRDANDSVVASATGSELNYVWTAIETPGNYKVQVDFAQGDNVAALASLDVTVGEPVVAETTPEPEATQPSGGGAAQPTPTTGGGATAPSAPVTGAEAVAATDANVRVGPGLSYGTIAGGIRGGTKVTLIGRNADNTWLKVRLADGQEGWIFRELLTLSAGFDVNSLEVAQAPAPAAPPAAGATPPPAAAAPPPPAPVGNVGAFELGGQAAGMPAGTMQYAGMTWVKKQHKWSPGDSPDAVAGLINEAHAAGLKILLSIPGQLNPSSIDFQSYVNFLGGVAALGPDAIEVWNEMNIDREWPAGQIDPTSYVNNMLKPAYQKIKAANPNVMVITGAPAPTGYFGGCGGGGCDDAPYVAGMMAAGAGSYSDCVGVHYNEGIMPPSATSGDPRGAGGHYTRYFQGMINAYAAAGARQLCFTELGYLSGEEWGTLPAGFLWKAPYNLTVAEHAQYLAEAVRVAVNSGLVRLMIVFNVDFTTWGSDPQAGYAMIRPNGGCPACETLRAVMGR